MAATLTLVALPLVPAARSLTFARVRIGLFRTLVRMSASSLPIVLGSHADVSKAVDVPARPDPFDRIGGASPENAANIRVSPIAIGDTKRAVCSSIQSIANYRLQRALGAGFRLPALTERAAEL